MLAKTYVKAHLPFSKLQLTKTDMTNPWCANHVL